MNRRNTEIEEFAGKRRCDLYLLAADEIPFVQDGLRDGEHIRHWMHERFIEALTTSGKPWCLITGSLAERLRHSIKLIDGIVSDGKQL